MEQAGDQCWTYWMMVEKLGLLCCYPVEVIVFVAALIAVIAVAVTRASLCYCGCYYRVCNGFYG